MSELTEISPVLFEKGLSAPHVVDGVAYQYSGRKVTLVIRARVKDGWHFYSATEDNGTNIPTKNHQSQNDESRFAIDLFFEE